MSTPHIVEVVAEMVAQAFSATSLGAASAHETWQAVRPLMFGAAVMLVSSGVVTAVVVFAR